MIVPDADKAVIEPKKITDYCFNPQHAAGKHKARVFANALDLELEHAGELLAALLDAVRNRQARLGNSNEFGQSYVVDFEMERERKKATVRPIWIVENAKNYPRLITCYVL